MLMCWMDADRIYELGNQNSFLVKRAQSGGVRFSRDPFNLTNTHSRKVCTSAGFEIGIGTTANGIHSMPVSSTRRYAHKKLELGGRLLELDY